MNMFDLIRFAAAATKDSGSGGGGGLQMIIFIGGFIVLMYFFMFRPQSKERKERQQMLDILKKGDKIVTIGGIYGYVTNVKDKIVTVKIADNVKVEMARSGIAQVVDSKEEIKDETSLQAGQ
jgi:preprotein translocase subunit YajC